MSSDNPASLIIDVQQGLAAALLGLRNNPQAEDNMSALLSLLRRQRLPVIHILHCSVEPNSTLRPGLPGNAYKSEEKPLAGEKEFTKKVNSAFVGTGLEQYLRDSSISALVIVVLTTDHCVSASARTASGLGFEVILVGDATAAFERVGYTGVHYSADDIHPVNLVSLDDEFCVVRSTADVLGEMA
ncbi:MAG: isochorismatase family protein [Gammaproteobacteria bacterium]|nr:isochorismatase family protein [Gammaproteobacteria bacterium]